MGSECDFHSDWTVEQLVAALAAFRRIDDGADLFAFSITGDSHGRVAYVYLYGPGRDRISYDLEDWTQDNGEPDHAVHRGSVRSIDELLQVCRQWLRPGGK